MEAKDKEFSFEEGIEQLESIVRELEQKEVPLEQALNLFRQGIRLVQTCNNQLDYAEKQMQILMEKPNGELEIHPADFTVEG